MVYYNTIFYKNGLILHACVQGFRRGALVDFSKCFSRGAKSGEIVLFATQN